MMSQRILLGLVIGLAATASSAEIGSLRLRGGTIGLQAGNTDFRVPCGTVAFPCDGAALPLAASTTAPRTLSMQIGALDRARAGGPQGLKVSLLGKAALAQDLGVYGRIGTTVGRGPALGGAGAPGGGLSYGVGLSWELSRGASAVLGWDTYDMRSAIGDSREVRATSLGLQLRY